MGKRPIFMDLTSSTLWEGPATGIGRVENGLARHLLSSGLDLEFVFFDGAARGFRRIRREWWDLVLSGDDLRIVHATRPDDRRKRRWVRALKLQRNIALLLSRLQRRSGSVRLRRAAAWLQDKAAPTRYRSWLYRPDGGRREVASLGEILGEAVHFAERDILLSVGSGWTHHDYDAVLELIDTRGVRQVLLCHDLIPAQFPEFSSPRVAANFVRYMRAMLVRSWTVIYASTAVARDAAAFAARHGVVVPRSRVIPLGADEFRVPRTVAALPDALNPKRFALFVATLEPRKGHRFILDVWERLRQAGVPQRHGFQLVFVGRAGWNMGGLLERLRAPDARANGELWLEHVDDGELAALYGAAAFCVLPSRYEGFGLPVIEAFQHGRAVLASSAGALPEVVAGLSPCLDPMDADAWYQWMKRWIEDPQLVAEAEAAIAHGFKPRRMADFSREVAAVLRDAQAN